MDNSQDFKIIVWQNWLVVIENSWNSCNNVKDKIASDIVVRNRFKIFMSSSFLYKIQEDFNSVNNVNGKLNIL